MFLRKLLSLLAIVSLVTALPAAIVGCDLFNINIPGGNTNDNDDNDNDDNGNDNDDVDARFARFTDPNDESFSTPDVRDVDDEIVRFDTEADSIVWAETGAAYQPGSWPVNGNFLGSGGFQVRFGTVGGEKRAYFTETGPATICQIEPAGNGLSISATSSTVPQN